MPILNRSKALMGMALKLCCRCVRKPGLKQNFLLTAGG